jgi:hypothetical protein
MRYAVASLLAFALSHAVVDVGWAQQPREDGSEPPVRGSRAAPAAADFLRLVVPFFRSTTTAGFRSGAVVSAVNTATKSCEVRVDFVRGADPGDVACSVTGVVNGGFAKNFCSRSLPAGVAGCHFLCSPQVVSGEGKVAVFTADTSACRKVKFDPRVYYLSGTTTDTGVVAVSNTQILP